MSSQSKHADSCFESAIVDSFRCCLCLKVLRNPVQCQRNEHHFCKVCITTHLNQSLTCPSCKEPLSLEKVRPASQILMKLLSQLKIQCDYNQRGCDKVMKVEELETHHKVCPFAPVVCSNEDCREVVNRSDRASHEGQVCQFRTVRCSVCGENLIFRWFKMHGCVLKEDLEEVKSSVEKIEESVAQILTLLQPIDDYVFKGIKQDIIICGGQGCQYAEKYDWKNRQWLRQHQPLKFTQEYGTSFVFGRDMLVTGITAQGCSGRSDGMVALSLDENFRKAQWKSGPASLPYNCFGHATVLVKDHLLVLGGYQSSQLDGVYLVQLAAPYTSKMLGHMPEPRCHHGVGLFGNQVVIVGGLTNKGVSKEVLLYDLAKNKWEKLASLQNAVMKMATVCWRDNIILFGGQNTTNDSYPRNDVVMYNVTTQRSTMLPTLKTNRSMCAAVLTGTTAVVMGGNGIQTVEYLNLESGLSWEELPRMNEAHGGATAVVY